jgi:hypothetical protein
VSGKRLRWLGPWLLAGLTVGLPAAVIAAPLGPPIAPVLPASAVLPASLQPASNLQADARLATQLHRPIIILFSLPGCHFCDEVRRNYLLPLVRDAVPSQRPIVREIVVTGTQPVIGFGGESSAEQAMAKVYAIRVTPTVLMLDAAGKLLVPALRGGDTSGLYGAYLDGALQEAGQKTAAR